MEAKAEISPQAVIRRNEEIISGLIDGELMMVNIESGQYHQLNSTGQRIWELLETPKMLKDLCAELAGEYEVDEETCRSQVSVFIQELANRKGVILQNPEKGVINHGNIRKEDLDSAGDQGL